MHVPSDSDNFDPTDEAVIALTLQVLKHHKGLPGSLLPILHAIQHALGYIPPAAVPVLASGLQRSRAEIHGVISFYPHFRTVRAAPVRLELCRAEACQAMKGDELADYARTRLGCDFHETTNNGIASMHPVYCLGLCAQSPAVMLDGVPHARMTPAKLDRLLQAKGV